MRKKYPINQKETWPRSPSKRGGKEFEWFMHSREKKPKQMKLRGAGSEKEEEIGQLTSEGDEKTMCLKR